MNPENLRGRPLKNNKLTDEPDYYNNYYNVKLRERKIEERKNNKMMKRLRKLKQNIIFIIDNLKNDYDVDTINKFKSDLISNFNQPTINVH